MIGYYADNARHYAEGALFNAYRMKNVPAYRLQVEADLEDAAKFIAEALAVIAQKRADEIEREKVAA